GGGRGGSVGVAGSVPGGLRGEGQPRCWGQLPVRAVRVPGFKVLVPHLVVGGYPEVLEVAQPAGKFQEVRVPAAVNGRISKPNEVDRYRLLVQPGMSLRFDVIANRAGSPRDGG